MAYFLCSPITIGSVELTSVLPANQEQIQFRNNSIKDYSSIIIYIDKVSASPVSISSSIGEVTIIFEPCDRDREIKLIISNERPKNN